MHAYDCTMCGACCMNSAENQAEGYRWYIEIDDPKSQLLTRKDWQRKLVEHDEDGVPHVRILSDGRCAALEGSLGKRCACGIYKHRPSGCKRIEPGDVNCERARAERGISSVPRWL